MSNLKYSTTAQVGQTIKAYDFRPMEGRKNRYVEGVVVDRTSLHGAYVYQIKCTVDTSYPAEVDGGNRVGHDVYVPMELSMTEFDGRVSLVQI